MEEYYFLFALATAWLVFAAVQDVRKKEVSNWLNFSLLTLALAYRGFYSLINQDAWFFYFGLLGFGLFWLVGIAFYYGRVFAGGDAKMLWALGACLPIESFMGLWIIGFGFIFSILVIGAVYSLVWSFFVVERNWKKFKKEFLRRFLKGRRGFMWSALLGVALWAVHGGAYGLVAGIVVFLVPGIYFYLMALDKCMIKKIGPKDLQEGDWLERRVKAGKGWIEKSVHGLSLQEIKKLKKTGKSVLIKQGVPFVPAILVSFLIGAYFYFVML